MTGLGRRVLRHLLVAVVAGIIALCTIAGATFVGPKLGVDVSFAPRVAYAAACPQAIQLINSGFESPALPASNSTTPSGWTNYGIGAWSIPQAQVSGWKTTASPPEFEFWKSGAGGVPGYSGQFAELNAKGAGTVYQDIDTTLLQGQTFTYSFAHRGRNGVDTMAIQIGVPGQAANFTRQVSTGNTGWVVYTGSYKVPVGQTSTRFAYAAISSVGGVTTGNFLDDVSFGVPSCNVDLSVTKTSSNANQQYIPGTPVNYTVVVRNDSTFDAIGAAFTDTVPASITGVTWTCVASTGSTCGGAGTGSGNAISRSLNLIAGGTATFTITGTATSTAPPATIVNTATIVAPTGTTDTTPGNNTSSVTLTRANTSLTLAKTSAYSGPLQIGDTFEYRFIVTNTGAVPLTNVSVTDPLPNLGTINCPTTVLVPGASVTCTAPYTVLQADVDRGFINNSATATGTPPGSLTPPTATDTFRIDGSRAAGISLAKSASPNSNLVTGDRVTYSFSVVNTGNVTLTGIVVTDTHPGLGGVSCPVTTLGPGIGTICTATYTVTQADVNAGSVVNTASVTGTPPTGIQAPTATSTTTITMQRTPGISLNKTSTYPGGLVAGQVINYRFTVTNTGTVTLTNVKVTDLMVGLSAPSCPTTTLLPGQTVTCSATYTITLVDVDAGVIRNTATATGTPPAGLTAPTASDTEETPADRVARLTLNKSVSPGSGVVAGDVLTYSFRVANAGNVSITNMKVTDPLVGLSSVTCPQTTLLPGDSVTCTATYTVTQADVNTGTITNTATASGTPPTGVTPPSATASAIVTANRSSGISLSKTSNTSTLTVGQTVTYTFTAKNTGSVTLSNVTITDDSLPGLSGISCPANTTINPQQTIVCTATYVITQADVDRGLISNTASVTGTPPGNMTPPTDSDGDVINGNRTALISMTKTANPSVGVKVGNTVTYTYTVRNDGNVTLTNVTVTDNKLPATAISCAGGNPGGTNVIPTLLPGNSATCTATYVVTQANIDAAGQGATWKLTNQASVTGTPPSGLTPPTANSTATIQGNRAARINLLKTATYAEPLNVGSVITYSFRVINDGDVTLTLVSLIDNTYADLTIDCNPAAPGAQPIPATLAPGGSVTCTGTHTVTQAEVDNNSLSNLATVTGTDPDGVQVQDTSRVALPADQTPAISIIKTAANSSGDPAQNVVAGDVITYSFLIRNEGNLTLNDVQVSDPLPGLGTITCPPAINPLNPTETQTCTATYTVQQSDVDAGLIRNEASVSGQPANTQLPRVGARDDHTVTTRRTASLSIEKTADPTSDVVAGDAIAYTFVVENTGTVTLTNVTLSDALPGVTLNCGNGSGVIGTLAPGAIVTCTGTYTATQVDVNAGVIRNVAQVSGTPPIGMTAPSATDSVDVTTSRVAGITVDKEALSIPAGGVQRGDTITYRFTITNTGDVSLTNISLTDDLDGLSAITCDRTALNPGQVAVCEATYEVTQDDVDAGEIVNTVSVTAIPPTGITPPTGADSETVNTKRVATLTLSKRAEPMPTAIAVGDTITYVFEAQNDGTVTLTDVTISDPLDGLSTLTCTVDGDEVSQPVTLAPGQILECTATYTVIQSDIDTGQIVNTASVTGTPPDDVEPPRDTDTETVPEDPFARQARLQVVKTASPTNGLRLGDTVGYQLSVRNTGNVTLTNVTVTDSLPGLTGLDCDPTTAGEQTVIPTLAPGPTHAVTCTATYVVTQADVDAGQIVNGARVTGTPPAGVTAPDPATDAETVTTIQTTGLSVTKSASPATGLNAGDDVTYTFVVKNTGTVTLTNVTVSDPLPGLGDIDCTPATGAQSTIATLVPGAEVTCTATYEVTQTDVDNGTLSNRVRVTGTPPAGVPTIPTAEDTTTITMTQVASVALTKTASPRTGLVKGDEITYTFAVENTGTVTLANLTVSDPLVGLGDIDCGTGTNAISVLAPGATGECTASYVVTQADVDAGRIDNTATVRGAAQTGGALVQASGNETATTSRTAALTLEKAASPTTGVVVGDMVTYTFTVTNTGNVTVRNLSITDPMVGLSEIRCDQTTLLPDGEATCTATYRVQQKDVNAGSFTNRASVTADPPSGLARPTASDDSTVTTLRTASLSFEKTADPTSDVVAGDAIAYTFVVENTGTVTLTNVTLSDALPGVTLNCGNGSGVIGTLAPEAIVTCTGTYTATQIDVNAGVIHNSATVTGTPPTGMTAPTATDSADVTTSRVAGITVDKEALSIPAGGVQRGDTITYRFTITNTGDVSLTNISLTDDLDGLSAITCDRTALNPGQVAVCEATYEVTQDDVDAGEIVNNVSVTGIPPTGITPPIGTDSETVPTERIATLTLSKRAEPMPPSIAVDDTISYVFEARNDGTVTLTDVTISDPLDGLSTLTCTVDGDAVSQPVTLAPGQILECEASYIVTQDDVDVGEVVNTASVTGTPPEGVEPPNDTDTETVPADPADREAALNLTKTVAPRSGLRTGQTVTYTLRVDNTGDVTLTDVTVTDSLPGLTGLDCDPTTAGEQTVIPTLAPGPTHAVTCTATYVVTQADVDAGQIVNGARVTGTPPAGVDVPTPATSSTTATTIQTTVLSVTKSASPATELSVGDDVTYTFVVKNTGTVTLTNVSVTDPLPGLGEIDCISATGAQSVIPTLDPGAEVTCTATYTVTQADVDNGTLGNRVTVTGTPPTGVPTIPTAEDTTTIEMTRVASVGLTKTSSPTSNLAFGDEVTYTFEIENTGTVTLANLTVTDPLVGLGDIDCGTGTNVIPSLSPDDDPIICTASYMVTQADVDAGRIDNTATVRGAAQTGGALVQASDDVTVLTSQSASLTVEKSADPATGVVVGAVVTYTFTVTNTGTVTLRNLSITDPMVGLSEITCSQTTLLPGDQVACEATYLVTQGDVDAGSFVNSATVTADPPIGLEPPSGDDTTTVSADQTGEFTFTKSVSQDTAVAGDTLTYTIVLTNTGTVSLTDIAIADSMSGLSPLDCDTPVDGILPSGGVVTCTATYEVTQDDVDAGEIVNNATGSAQPVPDTLPDLESKSASTTVTLERSPGLTIVKSADPASGEGLGVDDTITYSFVVTNTGNVTIESFTVTDELEGLSDISCPATRLEVGGDPVTCTAIYTVTQEDVDNGSVVNAATVTGTPPLGVPPIGPIPSNEVTVPLAQEPGIRILKSANPSSGVVAGDTITYTYLVENTGNVTLNDVVIDDPKSGLTWVTGPDLGTIGVDGSATGTATYVVTQDEVEAGLVTNTATASGVPSGADEPIGSEPSTSEVPTDVTVSLLLEKTASPDRDVVLDDVITYTFTVTNTGTVNAENLTITDELEGLGPITCEATSLAPGIGTTCEATYTVTQEDVDADEIVNRAIASATRTGDDPGEPVTSNPSSVTVPVANPTGGIRLTKTSDVPDGTSLTVGDTVTYTFLVENTSTLTLTDVVVADPLPGLTWLTEPTIAEMAPGTSLTLQATYIITAGDVANGQVDNTATATGQKPNDGGIATDTSSATVQTREPDSAAIWLQKRSDPAQIAEVGDLVTYTFLVTNVGNVPLTNVRVDDPMPGLSSITPVQVDLLEPGDEVEFTATYTVSVADADAGVVLNTAVATGLDPLGNPVRDEGDNQLRACKLAPTPTPGEEVVPTQATAATPIVGGVTPQPTEDPADGAAETPDCEPLPPTPTDTPPVIPTQGPRPTQSPGPQPTQGPGPQPTQSSGGGGSNGGGGGSGGVATPAISNLPNTGQGLDTRGSTTPWLLTIAGMLGAIAIGSFLKGRKRLTHE